MVCATARRAPNNAYLEFDAHPDHRIEYTARLDVARINKAPRFILIRGYGIGMGIHMDMARVKARDGAMVNNSIDDVEGWRGSLINNFKASATGCSTPYGPTMLGPFRNCIYPKTLRSIKVRNAIARRIGITIKIKLIKYMNVKERNWTSDSKVLSFMQLPGSATLTNPYLGCRLLVVKELI